jgi:hypothetical protein
LLIDLAVALAILILVLVPLTHAFFQSQRLARASYQRALAVEIVDGEMEALRAGEWQAYQEGAQAYPVRAASATNLPPGRFILSRAPDRLRLEWIPEREEAISGVAREIRLQP